LALSRRRWPSASRCCGSQSYNGPPFLDSYFYCSRRSCSVSATRGPTGAGAYVQLLRKLRSFPMEVILRRAVENLGKPGDVVKLKNGYARNYLLPHNLAYEATPGNLKRIQQE